MWLTCGGDRRYLFVGSLTVAACSASISRHFALRKLKTGSDPNVVHCGGDRRYHSLDASLSPPAQREGM
jgi:hypothetical protein